MVITQVVNEFPNKLLCVLFILSNFELGSHMFYLCERAAMPGRFIERS